MQTFRDLTLDFKFEKKTVFVVVAESKNAPISITSLRTSHHVRNFVHVFNIIKKLKPE